MTRRSPSVVVMTVQTPLAPAGIEPVLTEAEIAQFNELGYVIVKGALDRPTAEHFRNQIISLVPPTLDMPESWDSWDGRVKPMYTPGNHTWDTTDLIPLMANEKLYRAAAQLLQSPKLRVSDGSIGITFRNDAHRETPLSQTLHIDASVPKDHDQFLFSIEELQVGGCYYLTDVKPNGGGIHVVPGGHKIVEEEARKDPKGRQLHEKWKRITHLESIEVTGEAGDFALLHHLMPHGASHNRLSTTRVAYFVRWVREDHAHGEGAKRAPGRYNNQQADAMGPIGRKLFGVEDW